MKIGTIVYDITRNRETACSFNIYEKYLISDLFYVERWMLSYDNLTGFLIFLIISFKQSVAIVIMLDLDSVGA